MVEKKTASKAGRAAMPGPWNRPSFSRSISYLSTFRSLRASVSHTGSACRMPFRVTGGRSRGGLLAGRSTGWSWTPSASTFLGTAAPCRYLGASQPRSRPRRCGRPRRGRRPRRSSPARSVGRSALSRARRAGAGLARRRSRAPVVEGWRHAVLPPRADHDGAGGGDVERVRVRGARAPLRRRLPHLRAAAVVRRPRRWQLRDDEVRERAVDLGAPELARDAPLPGRRPLTGPQAHSVLRPKRGRPSGWAAARLRSDELLIGSIAGSLRRRELDRVLRWRGDHVTVKQVVDDFAPYLYPPRLQAPEVLHRAVADGAGLRTRSGFDENPKKPRIRWENRGALRVRTGQKTPDRTRNGWQYGWQWAAKRNIHGRVLPSPRWPAVRRQPATIRRDQADTETGQPHSHDLADEVRWLAMPPVGEMVDRVPRWRHQRRPVRRRERRCLRGHRRSQRDD